MMSLELWEDVREFLELAGAKQSTADETRQYVERIPVQEAEFAIKSPARKTIKHKTLRRGASRCTEGRWRTIDGRPVFICD